MFRPLVAFVGGGLLVAGSALPCAARPGSAQARHELVATADSLWGSPADSIRNGLPETPTLAELLGFAVRHSPDLRAAFSEWAAALERVPQASAWPDPMLQWAWFLREVETRVGPQEQRFALTQAYPWFGTLAARGDAALEEARAAASRFEARRLRLLARVTRAYAELYHLDRAIELTQENLDLMKHWEEVARVRFRVAKGSHAEVIKAQVEIGTFTDRLRTLRDRRSAALAALNALLPRAADAPLQTPPALPDETTGTEDAVLLAAMREANPELEALRHEVAARSHEIRLAGKLGLPNFSFGVDWVVTGEAVNPNLEDSGKDPLAARVGMTLPLWRGKIRAAREEAAARKRVAAFRLADRSEQLAAEVARVAFELRDAGRKVRLYRDTLIPKSDQSLRATSTAFEAGELDFLNVIDAQRVLLEFQLAYQRALADQLARRAELERLIGRSLPRFQGGNR